jgi:hypothetical protein
VENIEHLVGNSDEQRVVDIEKKRSWEGVVKGTDEKKKTESYGMINLIFNPHSGVIFERL